MIQIVHYTDLPRSINLDVEPVHLWWVALEPPLQTLPGRLALLSADEKDRANQFHFERHRIRYVTGRAYLRRLLGSYLDIEPVQIEFEYSPLGKPAVKNVSNGRVLQFNLSNSEDRALVALSWQHCVGIDLEFIHPMPDEDDFARQFFCDSECSLLSSLSGAAKRQTFFELWTCKEALLKAMGSGLTIPINEVEVALQNGKASLVSFGGNSSLVSDWQFEIFQPATGFQAALAFNGQISKPILFHSFDGFEECTKTGK